MRQPPSKRAKKIIMDKRRAYCFLQNDLAHQDAIQAAQVEREFCTPQERQYWDDVIDLIKLYK